MEKKTLHAAEQHREDVAEERAEWQELQKTLDIKGRVPAGSGTAKSQRFDIACYCFSLFTL
jgi:hypothetical protein